MDMFAIANNDFFVYLESYFVWKFSEEHGPQLTFCTIRHLAEPASELKRKRTGFFPLKSCFLSLPLATYMVKPEDFEWKDCSILINQSEPLPSSSAAKKWAQKDWEEIIDERTADKYGEYNQNITQSTANLFDPGQLPVTSFGQELLNYRTQNDGDCKDAHGGVWVEGVRPLLLRDQCKNPATPYHQTNDHLGCGEKS